MLGPAQFGGSGVPPTGNQSLDGIRGMAQSTITPESGQETFNPARIMKTIHPTAAQYQAFAKRVLSTLPDSLSAQISELIVLVKVLPHDSESKITALRMLRALQSAEAAQKEFCFTEPHKHDGHHNGGKNA